jgi:diacylglycerol kinase
MGNENKKKGWLLISLLPILVILSPYVELLNTVIELILVLSGRI